ncbi:MAG: KEOPS complex kinase/ATPase Bud32 [Candidatus Nanohaloarchaea archaeon]|nr:KEOPS complex kinase/ATPase Bud32 [Candidatus Nanohaloarchaea archaeon]
MQMIRGAEARLTRDGDRLSKERVRKTYRHPDIDERLRTERTEQEARLLKKAEQAGVKTPEVFEQDGTTIVMEFIDGTMLRDCFEEREGLWQDFGEDIARLHARDIIHGDLTTSNVLILEGDLVFIDFGLGFFSQRIEDRATDLRLLEQVVEATHHTVAEQAMEQILTGYRSISSDPDAVMDRLAEIRGRGRYS